MVFARRGMAAALTWSIALHAAVLFAVLTASWPVERGDPRSQPPVVWLEGWVITSAPAPSGAPPEDPADEEPPAAPAPAGPVGESASEEAVSESASEEPATPAPAPETAVVEALEG